MVRRMSARWRPLATLLCLALLAEASALAQEVEVQAQAPADASGPRPAELERPRPPPPLLVAVLPSRGVSEEVTTAIGEAIVETARPWSGRREVHRVAAPELLGAIAACRDDVCTGGQLATAGAQAGVIVRTRRRRATVSLTFEIRDPVSGASRFEAVEGSVPNATEGLAEALAPLIAQLQSGLPPAPPPPATILVTANVDGASVSIDGVDIGETPVAAEELVEGTHEVMVTRRGYVATRRRVELAPGEQERVDVTLREIGAEAVAAAGGPAYEGNGDPSSEWREPEPAGDVTGEWWFWTLIGVGAAVLIGVAIGIGVAVGESGGQGDPSGIRLPPIMGGS